MSTAAPTAHQPDTRASFMGDWIKSANGVLSIVAVMIGCGFTAATLIYSQSLALADGKTYNEQHFQTKAEADGMEDRIMNALDPIAKDASSAAKDAAATKSALDTFLKTL